MRIQTFMFVRERRLWAVGAILLAMIVTAIGIAGSYGKWRSRKAAVQVAPSAAPAPRYPLRAALTPQLRETLSALGNRLEVPGNERLVLQGTISRPALSETLPVRLIMEFPDQLRLEEQVGDQMRVIGFGGQGIWKTGAVLRPENQAEVETLLYDSAEHFFAGQGQGFAIRPLGSGFRLDDGRAANYTGPFYDLYQVDDQLATEKPAVIRPKLYYFNSVTRLLERVRYRIARNGAPVNVETLIGGWQKVGSQQVPSKISRLENNTPVMILTVTAASLTPHVSDGVFNNPTAILGLNGSKGITAAPLSR
jgi:hypothetical protein